MLKVDKLVLASVREAPTGRPGDLGLGVQHGHSKISQAVAIGTEGLPPDGPAAKAGRNLQPLPRGAANSRKT